MNRYRHLALLSALLAGAGPASASAAPHPPDVAPSGAPAGAEDKKKDDEKPAPKKSTPTKAAPSKAPAKPAPSQPATKPATPAQPTSKPATPTPSQPASKPATPPQPATPTPSQPATPGQPTTKPAGPTAPSQPAVKQADPTPANPALPANRPGAGQTSPGAPAGATPTSGGPPRHDTRSDAEAAHLRHPPAGRSDAERAQDHRSPPPHHSNDHRYARPRSAAVRAYPDARHGPPPSRWYRPYYAQWWVHPYYRWVHATVSIVLFDYTVYAWTHDWAPPPRAGWVWVPGHMEAWWIPGHWEPAGPVPVSYGGHWVYVPGWWVGDRYMEGYYRAADRGPGWTWVEGRWTGEGVYQWGHWEPVNRTPAGYVWEAGYWDGEDWVDGFWRPQLRNGYRWVSAAFDEDGVFEGGYWEPVVDRPDSTWIPGWFDGNEWVDGYWVSNVEYNAATPDTYNPPPGFDDGWSDDTAGASSTPANPDEQPLAIPVQ